MWISMWICGVDLIERRSKRLIKVLQKKKKDLHDRKNEEWY